jgi:hypothetical protein
VNAIQLQLGQVVATAGVDSWAKEKSPEWRISPLIQAVQRHQRGDWGEVCDEDKKLNDEAVDGEGRILSAYTVDGEKVWVITEWDRSVTTVLFPSEY